MHFECLMQLVYFEVAPSVDIFQDSETSKLFSVPDSLKGGFNFEVQPHVDAIVAAS